MTVKKATTEMERVMSLLEASMTEPVALIAEAPHLRKQRAAGGETRRTSARENRSFRKIFRLVSIP